MGYARDFVTALQFLTRIHIVEQSDWSNSAFARSVKFFPLVGAVLGLIYMGVMLAANSYWNGAPPAPLIGALFIILSIMITGGIHTDGLMDTMDAIFSGRTRERMLEIMKDSHVGANGVTAFCVILLLKYAFLSSAPSVRLPEILFAMPIIGRTAAVLGVTCFPYCRKEGLGYGFTVGQGRMTLMIGLLSMGLALSLVNVKLLFIAGITLFTITLFASYVQKKIGGLTGDVYGAMVELSEVTVLLCFAF